MKDPNKVKQFMECARNGDLVSLEFSFDQTRIPVCYNLYMISQIGSHQLHMMFLDVERLSIDQTSARGLLDAYLQIILEDSPYQERLFYHVKNTSDDDCWADWLDFYCSDFEFELV